MWLLRKRRRNSSRDHSLVKFVVPGKGALVMDGTAVVKLRMAADEVGGSSLELVDRDGDLAIALNVPGVEAADRASVLQRFCRLAGLPLPE
jgi:hypothetical protein